ncbi:GIY-YIG nuclease family protein [Porticoccus sp. W117]|uniref:GIY-YIG nuclease family protein n=1 Tax=Porticoccus sp. W117 TaxID=3054777 RepID=UPI002596D7C5|nr:GIY-YIG nuclease family protein [Porticoccus sp. W117]MDM3870550.1 GIY-YIG nuclease family protein [Porticoccus sp. W117]
MPSSSSFFVYILTNHFNRVLYTGITNNLERRLYEHRSGSVPGFTSQYRCHKLVYFEETPSVRSAIEREKQIKSWRRAKKVALIESQNPAWKELLEL